ncbi:MAG: FtsW/RodA/SpoVE family cell cycle protein [bacterium]|nr:FtsW/RodA/SpoVE family cell cycle protein [bacterium]
MNRRLRSLVAAVETGDKLLLGAMGLLLFLGCIVVYGAGSYNNPGGGSILGQHFLISKHIFMIIVGFVVMMALSNLNYRIFTLRWLNWPALALSVALVGFTLTQGTDGVINRWVSVGGFRFQPVEMAKLAVILFLAERWAHHSKMGQMTWKNMFPGLLLGPLPLFYLLYKQPNFGNILTMSVVVLVAMLVAGLAWKQLAAAVAFPVVLGLVAINTSTKLENRLADWLKGLQTGSFGYQVDQSLMGMGAGGPVGLGAGNSHNKFAFLPEAHTDFILSVMGEELGLWGTLLVVGCLVLFIWRGYGIAAKSTDPFGQIVAAGLTTSLAVYGLVNIGMVTGAFPVVGVPLPFVSFGGTAMVAAFASVGILLNIDHSSKHINLTQRRAQDRRYY